MINKMIQAELSERNILDCSNHFLDYFEPSDSRAFVDPCVCVLLYLSSTQAPLLFQ